MECKKLFPAGHKKMEEITLKREDIKKLSDLDVSSREKSGGCCCSKINQLIRCYKRRKLDSKKVR